MNYKKLVLEKLLDKYERSKAFSEGASKRRILLRISSELPEYDVEKPVVRETFNSAVLELAQKGLVQYEWLKYEKGHILDEVWLDLTRAEAAYAEIGRKAKREVLEDLLQQVRELQAASTAAWVVRFLDEVAQSITTRNSIAGLLPAEEETAAAVLRAVYSIQLLDNGGCLERTFSLRFFGDSKFFERKIRPKVVSIVRKYCISPEAPEELNDDDVLLQVGIFQSPDMVDFKGGISGRIGGTAVDFSAFRHGASINAETVRELEVTGMRNVRRIFFIENKANYIDFVARNTDDTAMAVFHGGFYSPCRGLFFRKLYEAAGRKQVEFYHWGDIDLGGFKIFQRLKSNIIPELKPWRMDREALLERMEYATGFDKAYGDKLRLVMMDERYGEFRDVIEVMLDKGIRLEQEAFLI